MPPTLTSGSTVVERDIPYAPEYGLRGSLDLYLPDATCSYPLVMVIHGGGLQALHKERMAGVSAFIADREWAAVTVNYRLLPGHPFPAPLLDILRAYQWVQDTDHEAIRHQDRTRVALLGASAGGYLALAAGAILGRERVRAMVSISGPATVCRYGAPTGDPVEDPRLFWPPVDLVGPGAPPLLAVHSRNDELVKPSESAAVVEAMQRAGCRAALYLYDGPGDLHGIWRSEEPAPRLLEHIEDQIAAFLSEVL